MYTVYTKVTSRHIANSTLVQYTHLTSCILPHVHPTQLAMILPHMRVGEFVTGSPHMQVVKIHLSDLWKGHLAGDLLVGMCL